MQIFQTNDLLALFPEIAQEVGKKFNYFTRHHEFALVPAMHLLIKKTFEDVDKNPEKYGITDTASVNTPQETKVLALNGNILLIQPGKEKWYNDECSAYLSFDDGLYFYGKEEAYNDFLEKLTEFAKTLDQNALMSEAKEIIGNSGILPIPWEWKEFYDL